MLAYGLVDRAQALTVLGEGLTSYMVITWLAAFVALSYKLMTVAQGIDSEYGKTGAIGY